MGFLTSVFGEPALRRSLRDLLRSRLVKEEALRSFVDRHVPRELDLESSLRRMVGGLSDVLGGREGVERLLSSGPDPSPRSRALEFAFRRAIDPGRATPLDVEQVVSYFLTQEERLPRKKVASFFSARDFADRATYENHRDQVLALAPAVSEVYARWFGDRDLYGVRELWRLFRVALRRFQSLKQSRRGLDFTDVLLRAVKLLERREEFSQSRFRLGVSIPSSPHRRVSRHQRRPMATAAGAHRFLGGRLWSGSGDDLGRAIVRKGQRPASGTFHLYRRRPEAIHLRLARRPGGGDGKSCAASVEAETEGWPTP